MRWASRSSTRCSCPSCGRRSDIGTRHHDITCSGDRNPADRKLDLVLVGASGFVGRLTGVISPRTPPLDCGIGLAGRSADTARPGAGNPAGSRSRLGGHRRRHPGRPGGGRPGGADTCRRVRGGKYLRYGLPLVRACAAAAPATPISPGRRSSSGAASTRPTGAPSSAVLGSSTPAASTPCRPTWAWGWRPTGRLRRGRNSSSRPSCTSPACGPVSAVARSTRCGSRSSRRPATRRRVV